MKKFLSLVLALVMTMSLVTISAGAKDYADASDITYVEAVDVLSELGVLQGDESGFRPTGTLKRSEAAKIICALNLTPKTAALLSADTAPFADVPASHWAAGYIAECVQSGIINGVGGGKFAPDSELTGYAYLKMLLVCLGYDATIEGMTGANWTINVAKLAKKAGLTDGNDKFVGTKAITREEAALYALNALEANVVTYSDKGTNITINGVVIATGASKAEVSDTEKYMDDLYEDLEKITADVKDDLGRPAHTWKNDGEKIGTYADTADYKFVLDADKTDLVDYLDDKEILEDSGYATGATYYVDGDPDAKDSGLKSGAKVEVFTNDADKITAVSIVNYKLGKIKKVDTAVKKADKEDGVTAYITIDGESKVNDDDFAGFDADTYTKDTYILYVKNGSKVIASEVAESVEGKVDAKSGAKVRIDGTYYKNVSGETISIKDEGTFYLNAAGQIIGCDAKKAASDKYAYVYELDTESKKNSDGIEDEVTTAYVVLTDGTKASYVVSEDTDVDPVKGMAYPYTINSDDEIEFEDAADRNDDITIKKDTVDKIDKKNSEAAGDELMTSTQFIFAYKDGSKMKVTTTTSYKNVNVSDAEVVVVADDGEALFVFVAKKNGNLTSDAEYAVLLSDEVVETEDDDNTYYTYKFAVDGEETELTVKKANAIKTLTEGAVYSYNMNGEYAESFTKLTKKTVTSANDEYFRVDGTRYEFGEETVYTVTMEYDADGDLDSVTVDKGGEIEKDDEVVYVLDDGDLDIVFVYEVID